MPFDGIVTKCVVTELSEILTGARIEKIFQPERDEIIINTRAKSQNLKLLLSIGANYPRIHITDATRENPAIPHVFCMLLRKHLSGGKILGVDFHDFERIITLNIEATNEMGDISTKRLIIEIMGRHSNIILVNQEGKIIDAIKHIDNEISRVREVMPAREYMLPPAQDKTSPSTLNIPEFLRSFSTVENKSVEGYLLESIKGFSPLICKEICFRGKIDSKKDIARLTDAEEKMLITALESVLSDISMSTFKPCILYTDKFKDKPVDFHCIPMTQNNFIEYLPSISATLDAFYSAKDKSERLKQKTADLAKVLKNSLDRCNKKLALQQEKLRDVANRDKLQLFGELIIANIYNISKNIKSVSLMNYYDENSGYIEIPLDENKTPQENAQKYFKQYSKAKSAFTYTSKQLEETLKELEYLESVQHVMESCITLQDIEETRQELIDQGYIHSSKAKTGKKKEKASLPLQFRSSDGFDIFVGRNNKQNDQLTLKLSSSNDMWLHTRNIPGSHVIIRKTQQAISDTALLEAATLAAFHSKSKTSSNVPVDYTTVKNVMKPSGAKPGMVIYENFKTLIVTPDEKVVEGLMVKKK